MLDKSDVSCLQGFNELGENDQTRIRDTLLKIDTKENDGAKPHYDGSSKRGKSKNHHKKSPTKPRTDVVRGREQARISKWFDEGERLGFFAPGVTANLFRFFSSEGGADSA